MIAAMPHMASVANAADAGIESYRYKDNQGRVVISRQGIPPEFISNGYEVLDVDGRVLRKVPPAPTLEERQRLAEEKARAKSDVQLLRIYSEPVDVDRARDRKLAELDGVIRVAQSNLHSLRAQQANLQAQAADFERAGRKVPEHLLVQIDNLKAEQVGVEKDIQRHQQSRSDAEATFAADRARLVELRGE
ncbi:MULTISPECIES: DUF4124 domain-containing protein [unclassified Pseudomonas]|uniref:DUF4124 domain-containing protein n=1 Tax=unclassified Pseudomonas TaxID=196821 RepID=UPI0024480EA2|nr:MULTISPECIES: DUF4124 domain-containing protein [unclassified Pseudomonas]MDG9922368.1 DUF4124 domain-containing protein [Pseudomonas sp. GD04045]MDH0034434.1 DUF4124 domain-containing protein [Pseudomonas sp. GD04019]